MNAGEPVRAVRQRHGISQRSLAIRVGAGQATISRIECGRVSPTVDTLSLLLRAMGEELKLDSRPAKRDYDPAHLRALRERTPAERLQLAIGWNRPASRLTAEGRRQSSGD